MRGRIPFDLLRSHHALGCVPGQEALERAWEASDERVQTLCLVETIPREHCRDIILPTRAERFIN
jgi:hypothetical protein